MLQTLQSKRSLTTIVSEHSRKKNCMAFLALVLLEVLWFGPVIGRIGFYLDDWATYVNFHFAAQDISSLVKVSFSDPRLIPRPAEAIFFVASYLLFGLKPLGHHLANCIFEILTAWFFYLSLFRLSRNYVLALSPAMLFLLYPTHDATHYWATANAISLSLALYTASLWLSVRATEEKSLASEILAPLLFLASALTYEAFLPLCLTNLYCVFLLTKRTASCPDAALHTLTKSIPFVAAITVLFCYQRVFLSLMGKGMTHTSSCSFDHFLNVMASGLAVNFFPDGLTFFLQQATEGLKANCTFASVSILLAIIALLYFSLFRASHLFKSDVGSNQDVNFTNSQYLTLITLGIIVFFSSYTIFGIAAEYKPTLTSIWNRINIGASLGSAMVLVSLVALISSYLSKQKFARLSMLTVYLGLLAPLTLVMTLANWGLALPWITSWTFQKEIMHMVKSKSKHLQFRDGDSLLLAGTPRYVMWGPAFDGVWDFQPMIRLSLNNDKINGGVISDRMVIARDTDSQVVLKDVSRGVTCGTYPFHRFFLFIPHPEQWLEITSAQQFIAAVHDKGLGFGIDSKVISRWQHELQGQLAASEIKYK